MVLSGKSYQDQGDNWNHFNLEISPRRMLKYSDHLVWLLCQLTWCVFEALSIFYLKSFPAICPLIVPTKLLLAAMTKLWQFHLRKLNLIYFWSLNIAVVFFDTHKIITLNILDGGTQLQSTGMALRLFLNHLTLPYAHTHLEFYQEVTHNRLAI